jgi:hypothetical protein
MTLMTNKLRVLPRAVEGEIHLYTDGSYRTDLFGNKYAGYSVVSINLGTSKAYELRW